MARGTRRIQALLALPLLVSLAGCAEVEEPPPLLEVASWSATFEGEFLVVNVTIRNPSNLTPGAPVGPDPNIGVKLWEWRAAPSRGVGEELNHSHSQSIGLLLSRGMDAPRRERYYTGEAWERIGNASVTGPWGWVVGPVSFPPNSTATFGFVFIPRTNLSGGEGYYSVLVSLDAYVNGEGRRGSTFFGGCFNRDTAPFYGVAEGPDCPFYDRTGRFTAVGDAVDRFVNEGP